MFDTVFAVEDDVDFDIDGLDSEEEETAPMAENTYSEEYLKAMAQIEKERLEEGSQWRSMHIVDTAGIRRQKSVEGFIEQQSVYRSLRCITESDIIIFMIDSNIINIIYPRKK